MDFDRKFEARPERDAVDVAAVVRAAETRVGRVNRHAVLSGGYANLNLRLDTESGPIVARFTSRPRAAVEVEIALHERLAGDLPVPHVLGAALDMKDPTGHLVLLEFLDGESLARCEDDLMADDRFDLGRDIGACLARIHAVSFAKNGFFAPDLSIRDPLEPFAGSWRGYMEDCLDRDIVRARLGADLHHRLARFLEERGGLLDDLAPLARLVHSDFNQKNILVASREGRWRVSGILDWEFAHAGAPLADVGNFLRFEQEQPDYRDSLLAGYREGGGALPSDWEAKARFLDLASMLSFLVEAGNGPKTVQTAREVVARTLEDRFSA